MLHFVACRSGCGEVTAEGTLAALRLVAGRPRSLGLSALSGGVNHKVCVAALCSRLIAVIGTVAMKE